MKKVGAGDDPHLLSRIILYANYIYSGIIDSALTRGK